MEKLTNNAPDAFYDQALKNLLHYRSTARVVACFCEGITVRNILKAIRRAGVAGELLLFGSDGWADRHEVINEFEEEALGAMSVRIHSPYVQEFDQHYFSLHPDNNTRNPWFREFWQHRFNCSLPPVGTTVDEAVRATQALRQAAAAAAAAAASATSPQPNFLQIVDNATTNGRHFRFCSGKEDLSKGYSQDTKMAFVMKSLWTMAYGLHNMQQDLCPNTTGLCQAMLPVDGSLFLQYLMNVTFKWGNDVVSFDSNGDPPGRYDIMNLQFDADTGRTEYVHVKSYRFGSDQRQHSEDYKELQWPRSRVLELSNQTTELGIPTSVCSRPCPRGQAKVSDCWRLLLILLLLQ